MALCSGSFLFWKGKSVKNKTEVSLQEALTLLPPSASVTRSQWLLGNWCVRVYVFGVFFFFNKGQNVNNTGSYAFHFDLMTANGNDQNRRVTCPLFSSEMHIQIFKKKTRSNSPSQLSRPRTAGKSHEHLQFMIFKSCFWFPDEIFRLNVKVLTEGEILHVNTVRGEKKKTPPETDALAVHLLRPFLAFGSRFTPERLLAPKRVCASSEWDLKKFELFYRTQISNVKKKKS